MPLRSDVLEHAKQITCADREAQYGDPLLNFRMCADLKATFWRTLQAHNTPLWDAMNDAQMGAFVHALDMVLIKLSRIATAPTLEAALAEDHYVDGAAYFALAYEVGKRSLD